jgi:hypothetical protein
MLHVFNIEVDKSCLVLRENYAWNAAESAFVLAGND